MMCRLNTWQSASAQSVASQLSTYTCSERILIGTMQLVGSSITNQVAGGAKSSEMHTYYIPTISKPLCRRVCDTRSGKAAQSLRSFGLVGDIAWHPDEPHTVALANIRNAISFVDLRRGKAVQTLAYKYRVRVTLEC